MRCRRKAGPRAFSSWYTRASRQIGAVRSRSPALNRDSPRLIQWACTDPHPLLGVVVGRHDRDALQDRGPLDLVLRRGAQPVPVHEPPEGRGVRVLGVQPAQLRHPARVVHRVVREDSRQVRRPLRERHVLDAGMLQVVGHGPAVSGFAVSGPAVLLIPGLVFLLVFLGFSPGPPAPLPGWSFVLPQRVALSIFAPGQSAGFSPAGFSPPGSVRPYRTFVHSPTPAFSVPSCASCSPLRCNGPFGPLSRPLQLVLGVRPGPPGRPGPGAGRTRWSPGGRSGPAGQSRRAGSRSSPAGWRAARPSGPPAPAWNSWKNRASTSCVKRFPAAFRFRLCFRVLPALGFPRHALPVPALHEGPGGRPQHSSGCRRPA